MAIVTRFFVEKGPSNKDLQTYVGPSANAVERFRSPVCTIEYDDATPGLTETLDEYMDTLGYDNFTGNLAYDVFTRPGNPGAVLGRVRVYSLTIGGVTQLFARADDGTISQLTPKQSPVGSISGLTLAFTSISTVTIAAGSARDKNDNMDLVLAAPVVLDIAASGVNGLDTGVEAANSWYHAYVIGDSSGVNPTAGILSTSQNAPTFPAGYDVARRVGSVRNNASNFRDFQVFGNGSNRSVQYRDAISGRQRLTGGAATVVTAVSVSQLVPPTSDFVRLQYQQRGIVDAFLYDDPAQLLANAQRTLMAGATVCDVMRCTPARDIAYANAAIGGLLDIWVTGYDETV
jgi:hypothetical protein